MKKITFLFICYLTINLCFSQGTDVSSSEQFCSGTSELSFNNVFGGSDLTQVGCLGSIPNAAYFYLQIDQPGDLIFTISQEDTANNPIDVDFIAWGPFIDIADANASITLADCPECPNNTADPTFYPYAPDNITDCSFSAAPTETLNILNTLQGEIYVVLITNYNGDQGTIDFQQTSGNGTTSCETLPVCGSQYFDIGGTTGPYTGNESTTINPYFSGGTVTVDFTNVNIPDAGDVLTVYNGPNNTFPVLGTVTGAPISFSSTIVGNPTGAITFDFIVDGDANVGTGWVADITCSPPLTPPTCGSTFYDSGGAGGDYSNNELETTTFFPDTPGDAVTATFTAFNLDSCCDELRVYDGPNASFPLLGVFAGTTLPGPFSSSDASGALTFVFDSNESIVYDGWAANLTCATYVPPVICGSTFYDSGGVDGNYSSNDNATTTLIPDIPGTNLVANFTAFETEDTYDYLYIYDGPNNTFPLIGVPYTGTNSPGIVTSSHPSGALTFVFTSDGSSTDLGWVANISCVDLCNLIITDTNYPLGADACNLDYTALTTNAPTPPPTNIIFTENFNEAGLPAGWNSVNATADAQWISSNTSHAGGTANEVMLDWITSTVDNGTWTLTSPSIPIAGETNLQLNYNQYLWHYDDAYAFSIFVETNVDGGGWITQSSNLNVNASIGPNNPNLDLSSLSGTNIQIRFRMTGNPFGFYYWTIDNFELVGDSTPLPPQVTWSPTANLFTDPTLTTPYVGGFAGTVYATPSGIQLYTATDSNSCTDAVTVIYNKKTWNGSNNDNWYLGDNWTPIGVPTIDNCIVIPDNSSVPNNPIADKLSAPPFPLPPAEARNITLLSGAYFEIKTNTELIVQEWVNVQNTAILNLKSSSSLVQIEDSAVNTGDIHMQRSPNFDESAVAGTEYVYWSSPVSNFQVTNISPSSSQLFDWTPSVANGTAGNHGEWFSASGTMTDGTGYIVRGLVGTPATIPATAYAISNNTALFSGIPNNGVITKQIYHGNWNSGTYTGLGNIATNEDDNWNLLGNPYPSAISANAFTNLNTNINGTVYVWPHSSTANSAIDPFYEDYVYNYDGNDYIEHNNTGSNPPGTNDLFIGSSQAFFVMMNHSATSGTNVTFNNSMRQVLSTYDNSDFYRTDGSEYNANRNNIERHRIWLDLLSPNDITNTLLVGYVQNATNDFDRLYDGYDFSSGDNSGFCSLVNTEALSIQGRSLPFLQEDTVPLGVIANETGSHTIAINTIDGLFISEGQNIYIEDTELNIIHDIRLSPYSFTIDAGIHNDRFILRYTDETLGINQLDGNDGITISAPKSEYIKVTSEIGTINSVAIYDIVGRLIFKTKNINQAECILSETKLSDGAYIVKAELLNGKQKTQKLVIKQ